MTIGIIGGGAAGLMAAATILEHSENTFVHIFERNSILGQKIMISGGGRCNVTTGITDMRTLLGKYPRGQHFLKHALYTFPPHDVIHWFEKHGVPLKTEADLRIFPKSNKGKDVVDAFKYLFEQYGERIKVHYQCKIDHVEHHQEQFQISTPTEGIFTCDHLIITTGGQAYRRTGSTGDGYDFAEHFDHTITPLAPSLHSFHCKEEWPKQLAGLSFGKAYFMLQGEKQYAFEGPFLFTHKGVTGPAIFALSSLSAYEELSPNHPLHLFVDFLPQESHEQVEALLFEQQTKHPHSQIKTLLQLFLPSSLAEAIVSVLLLEGKKSNEVSKKDFYKIRDFIKRAPITLIGKGAGDEFVTAGGIATEEISNKTMESKKVPGLFFAGEVVNIDGFTGGFNLQAAWATGRLAGLAITTKNDH